MSAGQQPSWSTRLRALPAWARVAAGVVLVLVVVVVVLALTRGGGEGDDPAGSGANGSDGETAAGEDGASGGGGGSEGDPEPTLDADGTPRPTPEPGQTAPSPVETPDRLPPPVRVSLEEPADLGNGVSVRVSDIESVQGQGRGPGESSGPSLRVTVTVTNDSDEAMGMLSSVVTLAYGPRNTPADDLSGPGAQRFPESIAPGRQAEGRFVFQVPPDQRGQVAVDFRYSTEAPTAIFRGSA